MNLPEPDLRHVEVRHILRQLWSNRRGLGGCLLLQVVEGLDDLGGDPTTGQRIVLVDPQLGVQDLLQLRAGGGDEPV